jgi:hypothetical protein
MSEIKVNKISQRSGTAITLGNSGTDFQLPSGADIIAQSGSTITIAAGATITNSGTATGFGATGAVNWDTTPKTTTVTAVSGVGYFVNTTSGPITVNLPAGVAGSIVAISDYANTAATNNIIIDPNGTDKIQGVNTNYEITVNGGTVTLVFVDSTQGWRPTDAATSTSITPQPLFVTATGGCVATCGNYKIHSFTGPGTFCVSCGGNVAGSNKVDYMIVAGGGGGSGGPSNGGGAGGYRESKCATTSGCWTASPLASSTSLSVSATAYPITVGAGGSGGPSSCNPGSRGNNSVFSTITSTGGGAGFSCASLNPAAPGGSGGGARYYVSVAGAGNTPPVNPSQGNPGGIGIPSGAGNYPGGGGGGAGAAGTNGPSPNTNPGGPGGVGVSNSITGSSVTRAGGGGAGFFTPGGQGTGGNGGGGAGNGTAGTANTGGGGGSNGVAPNNAGGGGGSGIVVIRYKFQ